MEIRLTIKFIMLWKTIILLGIIFLLSACLHTEQEVAPSISITLMNIRCWRLLLISL